MPTGPEALSNSRVAEILSATLGRAIKYIDLRPEQVKQALLASRSPEWNADGVINLNELYRSGGESRVSNDVGNILGRKSTSFEQFSRDYASSFR